MTKRSILADILDSWGLKRSGPPVSGASRSLRLELDRKGGSSIHVGTLTIEPTRFVFTYSKSFQTSGLPLIPGFPDLEKTYEAELLFPFFQIRIPPRKRSDVARVVAANGIDDADTFTMLRVLGSRTVASPYHFSA